MTLYGTTTTNISTGVISFDAIRASIYGDTRSNNEHHELTVVRETDAGTYDCQDTHGRPWTLIDGEHEAELIPNF